ncbi:RagB/SusD family nutrient uptake outer membrane protein [Zobellia galactanivorans]|uniref:RagB/SusD family nutrient uptake outer membrane protein n=1 Tax=Zobellia galactanivorans (strain DSM 12802 / CCUG 47099 / CIP 106680 / NCIMB 13871 / Dsij) TaxID=63186 RepID=UPI0026E36451|nr:RagB/SusD family nutrient uptake outer membrane protein [Zobellia galactanivorans]MDO6806991.1 RagB/SusD family nutrient uptake outer membrane protein [Zobellia galactanivorans]
MKTIYIAAISMMLMTSCDNELDQVPLVDLESNNLESFAGVLNAAYYYHTGAVTPQAVMGEFRADNLTFEFDDEPPYPDFHTFNSDLGGLAISEIFFRPFYRDLYKSILSANTVIDKSDSATEVAEAKFLRALSYSKLVMVFGDVPVILTPQPDVSVIPDVDLTRQPATEVYNNVIIPDLQSAIEGLDNSGVATGRASKIAAQGILGKVYMYRGDFAQAAIELEAVINEAEAAGVTLEADFANVVIDESSEILFSTKISGSIPNSSTGTAFVGWFQGKDTKADQDNVTLSLLEAFDASSAAGGGTDLRKALSLSTDPEKPRIGGKYSADQFDQDFIELRLSDVILMYAEALNENGAPAEEVLDLLDPIRTRAGLTALDDTVLSSQTDVRQAILDERRLELAFEGHRWFDLVRTGTADDAMGQTINSNYYVFPIPPSEVLASDGVITQNEGY